MNREELFKKKAMIKINGKLFPCLTSAAMESIGGKWQRVISFHNLDGQKHIMNYEKKFLQV